MSADHQKKPTKAKRSGRISSGRSGFALVLILSVVVLLTFLVVAFLVRTLATQKVESSSMAGFRAEQLSITALDIILSDIRKEIAAGSDITTKDNVNIYRPVNKAVMVPVRALASTVPAGDAKYANLIKQSIRLVPFFPVTAPYNKNSSSPTLSGASTVSTGDVSANNRRMSESRWNLPFLLPDSGLTANQIPDWVYYSTQKGVITSDTLDRTISGRFAYNIYNIGSLLDVNVAGYPGNPTSTQMAAIKSAQAGSDLTKIPGISTAEQLVQWRNKASASSYANYVTGDGALNGFLKPTAGDKFFVNRQDLIRWVSAQSGGSVVAKALPFLTQFSREVNAPSWLPQTPANSTVDYAGQADATGTSNRFAPNVRVTTAFQRSDGSTAEVGEPLIARRFALSRIAGLGPNGIDATATSTQKAGVNSIADAATIQRDFGLVWDVPTRAWIYAGRSGTAPLTTIANLESVAIDGREPNFFELLKAAILSGSLGKDGGVSNSNTVDFDKIADHQIIQIGVNIIDQYRKDDLPTRVTFNPNKAPIFAGSTRLPTIDKMVRMFYRPPANTSTSLGNQPAWRPYIGAWFVPELWNPYQTSLLGGASAPLPNLRVRAMDNDEAHFIIDMILIEERIVDGQMQRYSAPQQYGASQIFTSGNSTISLASPDLSDYATPNVVRSGTSGNSLNNISDPGGFGSFFGIHVGYVSIPDSRARYNTPPDKLRLPSTQYQTQVLKSAKLDTIPLITFLIEYEDPSAPGQWRTYDFLKNTTSSSYEQGMDGYWSGQFDANGKLDGRQVIFQNTDYLPEGFRNDFEASFKPIQASAFQRTDPRTDRFGTSNAYSSQLGYLRANPVGSDQPPTSYNYFTTSDLPRKSSGPPMGDAGYNSLGVRIRGVGGATGLIGGQNSPGWFNANSDARIGALTDNTPGGNIHYADQDGIVRRAAGAYRSFMMDDLSMRPVMLNRPFYSVGDLGFASRGEPWKDVNFFTSESGDAALLDYFCAFEEPSVTAGRVAINSAPSEVVESLLTRSIATEATSVTELSQTDAKAIADALVKEIANNGPFLNRSDLVTRFMSDPSLALFPEKARREALIRSLSPTVQSRTWNFLIDLVVQSGRFLPAAQTLSQFLVEGERHVWLSVAIDRFTGKIVSQQLEVVRE